MFNWLLDEPVYKYPSIFQNYCDKINRADFFALIGKYAVELSEPTKTIKIPFHYGRRQVNDCSYGIGRAPDAQNGVDAIRDSFVTGMGLTFTDAGINMIYALILFSF